MILGPRQRLERAIALAQAKLFADIWPHGRVAAGCEGRALETALTLHLLRTSGGHREVQVRLEQYCRRYVAHGSTSSSSRAGRLDHLLSLAVTKGVLALPLSEHEVAGLQQVLSEFSHPTQWRKQALIHVLLAEIGVFPPPLLAIPRECARSRANHAWVALILTAIRILNALQTGRADEISGEDVQFLVAMQGENGGWEQHILGTLVILLTLARLGCARDSVTRGVQFVLSQVRKNGAVPFIPNEDTWVTCMTGHVLLQSGDFASRLGHVAAYLRAQQRPDGGWGYAEGVAQSDADDTSVCLMFLARQARADNRAAMGKAVRYLAALQNSDGGFPTFAHDAPSEAEITAKALQSLGELGRSQQGIVRKAWDWLLVNQREDGSFRTEWNLCSTFPILHVLEASETCGDFSPATVMGVRRRCVNYLLRHRRPDGGWPIHPDDRGTHSLSTAYALGALARVRYPLSTRELCRSAELVLASQRDDGAFVAPADSIGPRPFIVDVPALATVYSLWALARVRDALTATGARAPEPRSDDAPAPLAPAAGPIAGSAAGSDRWEQRARHSRRWPATEGPAE
jgi:squalene-hopene/tetraprenyl-beta-curcumene cyclase